jgi:hypothetical protein
MKTNQLVFYRHMKVQKSLRTTAMRKGIFKEKETERKITIRYKKMREKSVIQMEVG